MKIFFYIGPNKNLKSGFSIKFWKIKRNGRTVVASWGPAKVDSKRRTILKASWVRNKEWTFPSAQMARAEVNKRVEAQLTQGYYRIRRRRS